MAGGWLVHEGVRGQLARLDAAIEALVTGPDGEPPPVVGHLLARPGKRVRPALLLLAASLGECDPVLAERAAAAVELVHVGSLYHDDVMDRALSRRGVVAANRLWGDGASLAAGSYLLARALVTFAGLGASVNAAVGRACADLCAGQLHEVELAYDLDVTEEEVIELLRRKTGALLMLPCRIGALLARLDDDVATALESYGENLGLAFQLVDDLLDFVGDTRSLGKATHSDLRLGAYRLPVLLAVAEPGPDARRVRELLSRLNPLEAELEEAARLVAASAAVPEIRRRARAAAAAGARALNGLGDDPAVRSLRALATFVTERAT